MECLSHGDLHNAKVRCHCGNVSDMSGWEFLHCCLIFWSSSEISTAEWVGEQGSEAISFGSNASLYFFRRAERSLFAQGHARMISFFSRPPHPSEFHLFKSKFLGPYWWDSSDVCINTTTGSRSIIWQNFGRHMILAIKISIFGFFRGQRVYFWVLSLQ